MKKRLVSLLLIAFLVLTDIAPVITVAAEELGGLDDGSVIESVEETGTEEGSPLPMNRSCWKVSPLKRL